jgi:hypothetical protein
MPAAMNRATGKPVPQHGDQTAVQAQAAEARALEDAIRGTQPVGDVTVTIEVAAWSGRPIRVVIGPDDAR